MAYDTAAPASLIAGKIGDGARLWMYEEASAAASAVDADGYIANAYNLGMRVGDMVLVHNIATHIWTGHVVLVCASRSSPGANLSNGTVLADGSSNSD